MKHQPLDERLLPAATCITSLGLLIGQSLWRRCKTSASKQSQPLSFLSPSAYSKSTTGGLAILSIRAVRVASALTLAILCIATSSVPTDGHTLYHDIALAVAGVYAAGATLLSSVPPFTVHQRLSTHATCVIIAIFGSYAHRDIWPLLTYTLSPKDIHEGWFLWAKIGLATVAGILTPFFEPRPQASDKHYNAEETASWFSLLSFTFLDPLVWKGNWMRHLPTAELPPLCSYDSAKELVDRSYSEINLFGGSRGGKVKLTWEFLKFFRRSIALQAVLLMVQAALKLASPLGVNRLLSYLESGREDAVVRPWIWVVWIGIGPVLENVVHEYYRYIISVISVHIEAIVTSRVFDHTLRIPLPSCLEGSAGEAEPRPSSSNLVGKINNLVTSDLANISDGVDVMRLVVLSPFTFLFAMTFLYWILGWSAFVGLAVICALLQVPAWVTRSMSSVQREKMTATDARVTLITEVLSSLRMVKLFGWEGRVQDYIAHKRGAELDRIWRMKLLTLANNIINFTIPVVHIIVTFAVYTVVMKRELNASIVFSAITAFNMIRTEIHMVFQFLPQIVRAKVSIDRVEEFLSTIPLPKHFGQSDTSFTTNPPRPSDAVIGMAHATFSWAKPDGSAPASDYFNLQVEDRLYFKNGAINLVVGPTGSGKTSLLMALLGEMHYEPHGPNSWVNLPQVGGIAYAPQESWILNRTIRDNILFNSPYDKTRYNQVIYQCALERDISLFEAGDATEVGEKGVTLSGGQKARITLARAVYSHAQTLLLDDVLAALDVHTAQWIVDKCFKGDLMRERTVLLITHNIAIVEPIAEHVVDLSSNGRVRSQGSFKDALAADDELADKIPEEATLSRRLEQQQQETRDAELALEPEVPSGKLIADEEVVEGRAGWSTLKILFIAMGGQRPTLYWLWWFAISLLCEVSMPLQTWWLGWWARQYQSHPTSQINVAFYLAVYAGLVCVADVTHAVSVVTYNLGAIRASRTLHEQLVDSIARSTFRWLDKTPASRVIARCTQDVQSVDDSLSQSLRFFLQIHLTLVANFGAILSITPEFIFPGLIVGAVGFWIGHIFVKTQLPVKREVSIAKAPVLAAVNEALAGLAAIRAFAAEGTAREVLLRRIDHYTRISRTLYNLNRWLTLRIQLLNGMFSAGLAAYLVYGPKSINASNVGFSLATAAWFCETVLWCVRLLNDLEIQGNSLERIQHYLKIDHEPEARKGAAPPAYWPASGELRVEGLSARYSHDGPDVLKGLSFSVLSGERIGIVGRTGSGKSSLALSLLRCIPTEGAIYYDGIQTSALPLDALRSNVTVIPQVPELISGSLRRNLDMFGDYDDATLNDALQAVGFTSSTTDEQENKITLDSQISGGGSNFSVGQRQLIAIARAIVRQSKLLIMDEATSAIDYGTDVMIQAMLKRELKEDATVLVVAHRLQTIMDADRVMVLDSGHLVEFDTPKRLLTIKTSIFKSLVDESADRGDLYALAGIKA